MLWFRGLEVALWCENVNKKLRIDFVVWIKEFMNSDQEEAVIVWRHGSGYYSTNDT